MAFFHTVLWGNLASYSVRKSLSLVDPTLEKDGGENYFLSDLPILFFHATLLTKEQSITKKKPTCILLHHKHAQLHTLPQGSQRRCQTNYSTMAGSPVFRGKHTIKKYRCAVTA